MALEFAFDMGPFGMLRIPLHPLKGTENSK